MSTKEQKSEPDLDAEREVDIGHYLDALVARWWLPLAGIVVGVGTPFSVGGGAPLQGLATNPNTVARIARGQETIQKVASESGMSVRELRAGVSSRAIKSGLAKTAPNQLYVISVQGSHKDEVNRATAAIAARVVQGVGGYARLKRKTFQEELASDNRQLEAIDQHMEEVQAEMGRASGSERLTLATLLLTAEQRRGTLEQDRLQARQLLALAEQVELPSIIDRGVATKTTARSTRNSTAVAGLIGLILGILAALFWEPIAARTGRQ